MTSKHSANRVTKSPTKSVASRQPRAGGVNALERGPPRNTGNGGGRMFANPTLTASFENGCHERGKHACFSSRDRCRCSITASPILSSSKIRVYSLGKRSMRKPGTLFSSMTRCSVR